MMETEKTIYLKCDCKCCTLEITKDISNNEISYNIAMTDSYYHKYSGLWFRIKSALKVLFGKRIYYNDIYIDNPEKFYDFVKNLQNLIDDNNEECINHCVNFKKPLGLKF